MFRKSPKPDIYTFAVLYELEDRLKIQAKANFRFLMLFIASTILLLVLGLGLYAHGMARYGKILLFVWIPMFLVMIWRSRPWLAPKCPRCGKRMKKVIGRAEGTEIKIFFVCYPCQVRAYSQVSLIPS